MKKFTLSLVFAVLCTGGLFAQRTADVSVTEVIKPDTLYVNKQTAVHFVIKNNGPDQLSIGDTCKFLIQVTDQQQAPQFQGGFVLAKNLMLNDTLNVFTGIQALNHGTFDQKFIVLAVVVNAGALALEEDATFANNQFNKDVHFQGYGASVDGVSAYKLTASAYPNPTKNNVTVTFVAAGGSDYTVNIMDINGKLVQTVNGTSTNGTNNVNMNVSELPAGVYMYQLNMDNATSSNKLIITK